MKKYIVNEGRDLLIVGSTADIKAMYKSIVRNKSTDLRPLFCENPKFSKYKQVYGLIIDDDNFVRVISSDAAMEYILRDDTYDVTDYCYGGLRS